MRLESRFMQTLTSCRRWLWTWPKMNPLCDRQWTKLLFASIILWVTYVVLNLGKDWSVKWNHLINSCQGRTTRFIYCNQSTLLPGPACKCISFKHAHVLIDTHSPWVTRILCRRQWNWAFHYLQLYAEFAHNSTDLIENLTRSASKNNLLRPRLFHLLFTWVSNAELKNFLDSSWNCETRDEVNWQSSSWISAGVNSS